MHKYKNASVPLHVTAVNEIATIEGEQMSKFKFLIRYMRISLYYISSSATQKQIYSRLYRAYVILFFYMKRRFSKIAVAND